MHCCSCNALETICPSVFMLQSTLKQLNLEHNALTELPPAIGNLRSLVKVFFFLAFVGASG